MKKILVLLFFSLLAVCQIAQAQNIVYSIPYNAHYKIDYSFSEDEFDFDVYYIKTACEAGLLLFDDGSLMIVVQMKDNKAQTAQFKVRECMSDFGIAFIGKGDTDKESYVKFNNDGSLFYYEDRFSYDYDYRLEGDEKVTKDLFARIYKDFMNLSGPFFSHFTFFAEGKAEVPHHT